MRRKVLLITLEPIASQMAGPAIRCLEIGKQLSDEFDVTVFSPYLSDLQNCDEEVRNFKLATGLKRPELMRLVASSDITVIQANVLKKYPAIAKLSKYLVVDLYDPYLFSIHLQYKDNPIIAANSFALMHHVLNKHMLAADFAICASEQQRDYWIGRFCALGRLTPVLHHFDPTLRKLIDVVPFGVSVKPAQRSGPGLRDTIAGIAVNDPVALWGGGIWDWFDPLTLIRAVNDLSSTISNIRLVFMGIKSPNPQVEDMKMAAQAKQLSDSLGLTNRHIFFPQLWLKYSERANFLLDADIAVSAHFDLPESRFSFRTRILDYFWAHKPIITTCGDPLSELIQSNKAGIVVPYNDQIAWREALAAMLTDSGFRKECSRKSAELAKQFSWDKVIGPLRNYCRNPYNLPSFKHIHKPSLITRAKSVYQRGGKDLVMKQAIALVKELLP